MQTKAQITSDFIIRTVAPVFNKQGYSGTSISDITKATGLTKGAIYGNFTDKNELAVKAFIFNINFVSNKIQKAVDKEKSAINKLLAIAGFYKNYYQLTSDFGGCPILNIGIDANHQNPELLQKVKKAIHNLQKFTYTIIEDGKSSNEIKSEVDAEKYARKIFSMVEGAVFMSAILKSQLYMDDLVEALHQLILNELKK